MASQKAMGSAAIDARDLRRRTVRRFLEDLGSVASVSASALWRSPAANLRVGFQKQGIETDRISPSPPLSPRIGVMRPDLLVASQALMEASPTSTEEEQLVRETMQKGWKSEELAVRSLEPPSVAESMEIDELWRSGVHVWRCSGGELAGDGGADRTGEGEDDDDEDDDDKDGEFGQVSDSAGGDLAGERNTGS